MTKISYDFDVRFVDLDSLGHINNAVYLSYLEQLRVKWLKESGIFNSFNTRDPIPLILARSEIDYINQGYYQEKITCEGWVSRIGTKSFDISYNIITKDGTPTQLIAKAKSILVWFDYKLNQSIKIPDEVYMVLEKYKN